VVHLENSEKIGAAEFHVAMIMDGNGRWATQRGWPRLVGHRKGAERVEEIVRCAPDLGIKWLTIYAFSTENWKRSNKEILGLMSIFARYIERKANSLAAESVRMRFIGDRTRLDARLQRLMAGIEERTAQYSRLNLTVAINYGGRDELTRAMRGITIDVAEGRLDPSAVTEAVISQRLDTCNMPDPDLVIRTSGESRTSNFLPWQAAYAEFEFTPTLWPDFTRDELALIVKRFKNRERRFGDVAHGESQAELQGIGKNVKQSPKKSAHHEIELSKLSAFPVAGLKSIGT
jgi:undecaprenyl diphosphate synthase